MGGGQLIGCCTVAVESSIPAPEAGSCCCCFFLSRLFFFFLDCWDPDVYGFGFGKFALGWLSLEFWDKSSVTTFGRNQTTNFCKVRKFFVNIWGSFTELIELMGLMNSIWNSAKGLLFISMITENFVCNCCTSWVWKFLNSNGSGL